MEQLRVRLEHLSRSYGSYRTLKGCYYFPGFELVVTRVQSDPFAPPSWLQPETELPRIFSSASKLHRATLEAHLQIVETACA